MKRFLFSAAAFALIAPAAAQVASPNVQPARPQAQPAPQAPKAQTRADVQAMVAQHFARLDANRDGFVTKAEADAALQGGRGRLAERAKEKASEGRAQAFDRLDANHDGVISRSEWNAGSSLPRSAAEGVRANRRSRAMGSFTGRLFEMADANRDGRVSLQEAQSAALRHFDTMDANRDGRVTREERLQMRQRTRPESRG
jgi:Ca2+-binding EF-hand superfamily protein